MSKIPKYIHYCWFGHGEMGEKEKRCIESWKKFCPDYTVKCWNESNYDIKKNKYMQQAYQQRKWSFVSDYARLDIIYNCGGIYLDTDVELIRPLDDLLENEGFIGFETPDAVATGLCFGAYKGHDMVKNMLDMYDHLTFIKENGKLNMCPCTKYNTEVFVKYGLKLNNTLQVINHMTVYPKDYFCPKDYYTEKICLTANTYSIHHYAASWKNTSQKIRYMLNRWFRKIVGVDRGNEIVKKIKGK